MSNDKMERPATMTEWAWLEGRVSIEAAIRGQNRSVDTVYLRRGKWDRATRRLQKMAKGAGIRIKIVNDAFIAEYAAGKSHGGLLARAGPRRFASLEDLLDGSNNPLIVMLDGIEDPFNFGQAVRALYAAGITGLVVRPRNWLTATGTVTRSSAGATELMPTAVAESALEAAAFFRERGLIIACTAKESAVSLYETDLTGPLFLLIGGEKRGITRSFLDQADIRLNIPYGRSFRQSLGAAASTAVFAFELSRQRAQASSPDTA
jgi:23S rRNA (guanosine2251-2'-O)-methyltransferase